MRPLRTHPDLGHQQHVSDAFSSVEMAARPSSSPFWIIVELFLRRGQTSGRRAKLPFQPSPSPLPP